MTLPYPKAHITVGENISTNPRQQDRITPQNSLCFTPANLFPVTVSKSISFVRYWLVPLAWMSLIFVGSADSKSYEHSSRLIEPFLHWLFPHMSEDNVHLIHHIIRKCAHLTEYAVLGILLWRAIRKPVRSDPRPWSWREAAIAVLIVFAYASTDEFHQRYVPTRTPLVSDVFIDTGGAVIGMIALWSVGSTLKWWHNREAQDIDV